MSSAATAPESAQDEIRAELRRVFEKQRARRWEMARTTAGERVGRLRKLRAAVEARREEIARAMKADFGKPAAEVELSEIHPVLSEIAHTSAHLHEWMRPQPVDTPVLLAATRSELRYEPRGVALVIAPWNYPFGLLMTPLVAAIAAGNCAMLKPSNKTPHTSHVLKELVSSTFDESEVALFEGSVALGDALLELPFDHVFFTGSTRVGQKVMAAAARHLASVTLELGGKSPVVVDASADAGAAGERVAWGKYLNAGQTCIAPDYAFVHESKAEAFLASLRAAVARFYGASEEARAQSHDLCRLVDRASFTRVAAAIEGTVAAGARVEIGGRPDPETRFIPPTVLSGVAPDAPLMVEEIFGPVLPVLTFRERAEVFRHVQARGKPLALYVFARDEEAVEDVLRNTSAGGTVVNNVLLHYGNPNLPFGGVGASGLGSYHGHHGFKAFSHERAVLRQTGPALIKLFFPPYRGRVHALARRLLGLLG